MGKHNFDLVSFGSFAWKIDCCHLQYLPTFPVSHSSRNQELHRLGRQGSYWNGKNNIYIYMYTNIRVCICIHRAMCDSVWWTWIINDLSLVYPSHVFIYARDSIEWQCTCSFRWSSSLKDFDIATLLAQIDLSASQQEVLRNLRFGKKKRTYISLSNIN